MSNIQIIISRIENGHLVQFNDGDTALFYAAETDDSMKRSVSRVIREYLKDNKQTPQVIENSDES